MKSTIVSVRQQVWMSIPSNTYYTVRRYHKITIDISSHVCIALAKVNVILNMSELAIEQVRDDIS